MRSLQRIGVQRRARTLARFFVQNDSGATAIEYALIAALLGSAVLAAGVPVQQELSNLFQQVAIKVAEAI